MRIMWAMWQLSFKQVNESFYVFGGIKGLKQIVFL